MRSRSGPNIGLTEPLPSAPFSNDALKLYHGLLRAGMPEVTARAFGNREFDGKELTEVLSPDDLEVFLTWLAEQENVEMD